MVKLSDEILTIDGPLTCDKIITLCLYMKKKKLLSNRCVYKVRQYTIGC